LGFLCGAPPEFDELIRGIEESNDDEEKFPKVLDSSFSLSQFRFLGFFFIIYLFKKIWENTWEIGPFDPFGGSLPLYGF